MTLAELYADAGRDAPERLALRAPDGEFTYGDIDRRANRLAHALRARGVRPGDRVAVWLEKGGRAVTAMQAALRIGAAYVPVDPMSPPLRVEQILRDATPAALITSSQRVGGDLPTLVWDEGQEPVAVAPNDARLFEPTHDEALAYILYTSGSTGTPKGVAISHKNARAFIDWAAAAVGACRDDRFANHAPFHFDLSVFDLYVAAKVRATTCILPETLAYIAPRLVDFMRSERITVWYSVPSALVLMMEGGGLLNAKIEDLRVVVFAGEPFAVPHLARLHTHLGDGVVLWNFYGPTETNVCTAHRVRLSDLARASIPIGTAASFDTVYAERHDGSRASVGEEGELVVEGPTVMLGYFGKPAQGAIYRTGDLVRVLENDSFEYIGRRDLMVKVRGHRIELGDIEAALLKHAAVRDTAVVVHEQRLVAFIVSDAPPSLLAVKGHLASRLPRYMIVDAVEVLEALPRTRNGKTDRNALLARLTASR